MKSQDAEERFTLTERERKLYRNTEATLKSGKGEKDNKKGEEKVGRQEILTFSRFLNLMCEFVG